MSEVTLCFTDRSYTRKLCDTLLHRVMTSFDAVVETPTILISATISATRRGGVGKGKPRKQPSTVYITYKQKPHALVLQYHHVRREERDKEALSDPQLEWQEEKNPSTCCHTQLPCYSCFSKLLKYRLWGNIFSAMQDNAYKKKLIWIIVAEAEINSSSCKLTIWKWEPVAVEEFNLNLMMNSALTKCQK